MFVQFGLLRCLLLMPPAVLNLLDGPVDVDTVFHIVWSRFRVIRRYLAYCPEEEPRIFRMLDLISRWAQGHGPVHLLISAAELGFAWDGDEKGWVRVSLPPLRMMSGPAQHFRSAILDAWRFRVFLLGFLKGKVFWEVILLIFMVLYKYLPRPTCGKEIKCCQEHFVWESLERLPSWQGQEGRRSLSVLWRRGMVMVTCSGSVLSPLPPSSMFGNFLNLLVLCLWIVANGLVACFHRCLIILKFGLIVVGRISLLLGALRLLVLVSICLLQNLLLIIRSVGRLLNVARSIGRLLDHDSLVKTSAFG